MVIGIENCPRLVLTRATTSFTVIFVCLFVDCCCSSPCHFTKLAPAVLFFKAMEERAQQRMLRKKTLEEKKKKAEEEKLVREYELICFVVY